MVRYKSVLESEKGDVLNLCSLRATRRLLRCHWHWDIPELTVKEANYLFNIILHQLAEAITRSHATHNERLKRYGLRPKYRLSINEEFRTSVFKQVADISTGATGQHNRDTVVSKKQEIEVT
jgi:hypothetical protein